MAADTAGWLCDLHAGYIDQSLELLQDMLARESAGEVQASIAYALGRLRDPRGVPLLAALSHHAASDVRWAVACSLPLCAVMPADDAGGEEISLKPEAVPVLMRLMEDPDDDVRDWATFGLGTQLEVDTAEIRAALLRRLNDPHGDTSAEALVGLARRHDERVLEPLLGELDRDDAGTLILEAAEEMADARLLPALLRLRALKADDSYWSRCLDGAIVACTPTAGGDGRLEAQ